MIAVIRIAPFRLVCYWKKTVKGCFCRSCQIDCFIDVTGTQYRLVLSSGNLVNGSQVENNRLITDLHLTEITRIPIAFRHTEIPCLRPAVSSFGPCPTPAR